MKYVFTGETKTAYGVTLHRVAKIDGIVGGWIEKESNLSQEGLCWVSGEAQVYGTARVSGDARVSGNARVYGTAQVSGDARVYGTAQVSGNAQVFGTAQVSGEAQVSGTARVSGNAQVFGEARVSGDARVYGEAWVHFSCCTTDLATDVVASIRVQCNLLVCGGLVYCYKHVRADLASIHDPQFFYSVGTETVAADAEESSESCASGLHFSHPSYWEGKRGEKVLLCTVKLGDIITVQQGKIRARKATVIGVCDGQVF